MNEYFPSHEESNWLVSYRLNPALTEAATARSLRSRSRCLDDIADVINDKSFDKNASSVQELQ
ncbi:hypothetical protein HN747_01740 [archaeon]|jgi:hypothetical protein|nr:hypothetical protein [archaeon]